MPIYPYVYKLTHKTTGEFYIGYRCANKVPAEQDLGNKYFTSSKHIKPRFHEFIYHVVAEFFDKESAYAFEQTLIRENFDNKNILNKYYTSGDSKFIQAGKAPWNKGLNRDDPRVAAYAEKVGNSLKGKSSNRLGKHHTEEAKMRISESLKSNKLKQTNLGKTFSMETKQRMSEAKIGRLFSEDHKQKLSASRMGKKRGPYKTKNRPLTPLDDAYDSSSGS